MKKRLFDLFLLTGFATLANAHFVFVVPEAGGASAKIIMSEDLQPSQEVDITLIGGARLSVRNANGHEALLGLVKGKNAYLAALSGSGTRLIHGVVDLGVMQRGQAKPHLLIYYPKTILGDPFDGKTAAAGETIVEIVPVGNPGALRLELLVHGKPEANAEMTIILPDGTQKKVKTDHSGQTEVLKQTGRYGAWARYWENASGERGGKKYDETRHYATLVFDAPLPAPASATTQREALAATHFATLPQATSSFGAVISAGWLYVYGGHITPTHSYSTEAVSRRFDRLKLSDAATWEQLPAGPGLQGLNLAGHEGKIYRIGGMAPRNKPGEPTNNQSVAQCARFDHDPKTMKWGALPPLPEPRSSHDVVVIGNKLIVVGGWTLKGSARPEWRDTIEVLDLAAVKLEWRSEKQPFKRRALIAAAHSGKMYVLGGFDENAKIIRDVAVYDPATGVWTKGPELPGDGVNAFAPAACVHEGDLYVSVADGTLYRLNESEQQWEKSAVATPRIAHRIASQGKTILVIGGAAKGNNSDLIEAVTVRRSFAHESARELLKPTRDDRDAWAENVAGLHADSEVVHTNQAHLRVVALPAGAQDGTQQSELNQLRSEVNQLRGELQRLRSLVEAGPKTIEPAEARVAQTPPGAPDRAAKGEIEGKPQFTAAPENPKVAIATKAQGGDLSGAGTLLRTDRITIGGYGDLQFRESSINERADGGGTPTFQNTRFVLGIAAVLAEKQNIVFNSEIEYEFGSREIDVEQAFVEWKIRPQFAFRGGIFVPSIGRFNTYHDSNINLTTIRPLINQFIVPTAYRDAGIGVRGRLRLPHKMKLTYEADLVNGMQGLNADGEPTPFSRLLGQSSAAEPGLVAFQAPNRHKAVVGRVGLSPVNGLEFGVSAYNGRFNRLGDPSQSATLVFVDGSYHRGPLAINGEYGRSNIVGGGIARRSPAPPVFNLSDPDSTEALAKYVAARSPGQDGFYVEGAYNFSPRSFTRHGLDEGAYMAPVVRFEAVRLDRTLPDFYLNRSRTTIGLNFAPAPSFIFKFNYLFNHPFARVPQAPAGVGGALFGESPLPHLDYGRNGFTGSIAYVF